MSDDLFSLVLKSFSFCGVAESGGRRLVIAPSAFVVVPLNVSTPLVVLAVCSMTLVVSPLNVVLLVLVLPSSKLRDIDGASAATGGGGDSKDNMAELPYLPLRLLPMVGTMSPPDGH